MGMHHQLWVSRDGITEEIAPLTDLRFVDDLAIRLLPHRDNNLFGVFSDTFTGPGVDSFIETLRHRFGS